jgi:hypothetical protein
MDRTPSHRTGPDAHVAAVSGREEGKATEPAAVDRGDASARGARRPWATPRLTAHESLTVMTQHFFGPAGVALALQINCGVSGHKFGC